MYRLSLVPGTPFDVGGFAPSCSVFSCKGDLRLVLVRFVLLEREGFFEFSFPSGRLVVRIRPVGAAVPVATSFLPLRASQLP